MNRRLLLIFAVSFVPLTALDVATTHFAVHHCGYQEINICTDTQSLRTMIVPEIMTLAVGAAAVLLGGIWKGKELQKHANGGFSRFVNSAMRPRNVGGCLLIVSPIVLAIGRIFPVIGNSVLLAFGWTPFDAARNVLSSIFRIKRFGANCIMLGILFAFLIWPVLFLVFTAVRRSGQRDRAFS
jgi:hypothetical protein